MTATSQQSGALRKPLDFPCLSSSAKFGLSTAVSQPRNGTFGIFKRGASIVI